MATCQVDKISVVCEGGCGLICTSTQCWSWCEPVSSPVVIPVVMPAIMILRRGDATDEVPGEATALTMCVNGATRRSLVHVLQAILGQDVVSSTGAAGDTPVEPFSGTVADLLAQHDLRRVDL